MLIGATFKKAEISHWQDRLESNEIFRIFPNSDGLPPDWTDPRFRYCEDVGAVPFVSSNADGDQGKLRQLRAWLIRMESWVEVLYLTDRHEPEDFELPDGTTLTAKRFKANFHALMTMVNELPPPIRARIRCGPVMTKQWTENYPGHDYRDWDPGTGDFYGVDAYVNSWTPDGRTVFTEFPGAAGWLREIKTYRFDATDSRPRILAELGAIQPPWDRDGSARAAFLKDVHDELATWNPDTTGWAFQGWIWWNTEGMMGNSIARIGKRRWFQLDRRHNSRPIEHHGRIDPIGGFEESAANATLKMFNTLALSDGHRRNAEIASLRDAGRAPGAEWTRITLDAPAAEVAKVP